MSVEVYFALIATQRYDGDTLNEQQQLAAEFVEAHRDEATAKKKTAKSVFQKADSLVNCQGRICFPFELHMVKLPVLLFLRFLFSDRKIFFFFDAEIWEVEKVVYEIMIKIRRNYRYWGEKS